MTTEPELDLAAVWEQARKLMFDWSDRVTPTLQAMNVAVPIALEDGVLILGMDPRVSSMASHMQVPAQRADIKRALKVASGRDLDLRVIEGTALTDWERLKEGPTAPRVPDMVSPGAQTAWDELSVLMHNAYKELRQKQQALVRVRFLSVMLDEIARTADRAHAQEHTPEGFQRHLTQALDRLAAMSDIPATQVALEYLRRRGELH